MRITIENNELVYIYLLKIERKRGVVDETIPFVMGDLLYDEDDNWIGIRLKDQFEEYNGIEVNDEFEENIMISVNENEIEMFFDDNKINVYKSCKQDFNLDLVGKRLYGIEIIVSEENSIAKRSIQDAMIECDS